MFGGGFAAGRNSGKILGEREERRKAKSKHNSSCAEVKIKLFKQCVQTFKASNNSNCKSLSEDIEKVCKKNGSVKTRRSS